MVDRGLTGLPPGVSPARVGLSPARVGLSPVKVGLSGTGAVVTNTCRQSHVDGMEVTRVSVPVATRAPTGATNACVFGRSGSLLVDPAAVTGRLDEVIRQRDVTSVAVTHHHPDHVGALGHYARERDLTVWTRAGRERAFADATGVEPDRTFAGGDVLPTGSGPVHVVDTPGHAPEHVAFATGETLACGDLAVAEGSVAVGAPEGDMRAYLSSLRRIHTRAPARLVPGHGPPVRGTAVVETVERLLAHRLDRERRVVQAVRNGRETPEGICDEAYDRDLSGVRDLAVATVVAHLEKLDVEGTVRWNGRRALPV